MVPVSCNNCGDPVEVSSTTAVRRRVNGVLCDECGAIARARSKAKRTAHHSAATRPLPPTVFGPKVGVVPSWSPPVLYDDSAGLEYSKVAPKIERPAHGDVVPMRLVTTPAGEERWEEAPAEDETTVLYWRVAA
jgi:hypothetical protein